MNSCQKNKLLIAPCSHEAAKYAVEHWHYSKRMPSFKLIKYGAWENGLFIGCIIFSRGASPYLGMKYGLAQTDCCELTRVAFKTHKVAVTRTIAIAIKIVKKTNPGLKLIISFADPEQGHLGAIYQAGNWLYSGESSKTTVFCLNGETRHMRELYHKAKSGEINPKKEIHAGKHRYLMPLTPEMKKQIEPLRQPYPKKLSVSGVDTARQTSSRQVAV
jgi:hypothetical protein